MTKKIGSAGHRLPGSVAELEAAKTAANLIRQFTFAIARGNKFGNAFIFEAVTANFLL